MLGHASIQQTQCYLNVTDEELRKGLEVSWGRQLRLSQDSESAGHSIRLSQICPTAVGALTTEDWLAILDEFRNWPATAA